MNGLFAEHGLDVDILDPSGGPDNVVRVGSGGSDFALTSVQHYLSARSAHGELHARFVAMIVQRSPVGALVRSDSDIVEPGDLAGRRVAGEVANPQVAEFLASLRHREVPAPELVAMDNTAGREALAAGEVDGIVALVDALPRRRRQSGVELRAVRVGRDDIYGSGLVAGDRLPDDLVRQVRGAVVAALEAQRVSPEGGLDTMTARYSDDRTDDAPEGWALLEPFVFTDAPVGSMDAARWATTLEFLCAARGLEMPEPESVYRPELLLEPAQA